MKTRPFAYNPSKTPITGTEQVGDLAVGTEPYNIDYAGSGLPWWQGPDEDLGHIICEPYPSQDHPTADNTDNGAIRFWSLKETSDAKFIELVNRVYLQNFTTVNAAYGYLSTNGYWTSFIIVLGKIAAGYYHSFYINGNTKQTRGWGYNNRGQLGNNSIMDQSTPVSILGNNKTFCSIISGQHFLNVIDYTGQVWGWGYNLYGQLGNNSTTSKRTPVSILGTKKTFCKIAAGYNHSLGIDYTGQVWGWGYNTKGQLGINSVTNQSTPVSILGSKKTFCHISGNYNHSLGIDYTGQVWGWGYNITGQIGNNSVESTSTPVSILGTKKTFCYIASGSWNHSLGIDYKGQIWGWGFNNKGQLGINSVTNQSTPVSILGTKKTFCNIIMGYRQSCGIDYKGQVWGWGYNDRGQLGNNTIVSERTPVSILGTKKTFCAIAAGWAHSFGLDYVGQVWCWGYNAYGQLGINSTASYRTPVMIVYL